MWPLAHPRDYNFQNSFLTCGVRIAIHGTDAELIAAIVEMKRRNPRFGYQRIADQVALAFDVPVDKHLVRRVPARHCGPDPGSGGPSWLTFLGNSKDSLWSVDLFRRESLILRTHWVMVVMDQYTRRIVGFAVCCGSPDGPTACRMLRHIILGSAPPTYLSSDRDPLFEQKWSPIFEQPCKVWSISRGRQSTWQRGNSNRLSSRRRCLGGDPGRRDGCRTGEPLSDSPEHDRQVEAHGARQHESHVSPGPFGRRGGIGHTRYIRICCGIA